MADKLPRAAAMLPADSNPALSALPGHQDLAYRDDLTGLHNRRLLMELFGERWQALVDRYGSVALIVMDLDLFKEVNDTWGHMAGDEALRAAGEQLRRHLRESDLLVRYGGDEFVAVLPGVGEPEAGGLVERARQALASHRFRPGPGQAEVELPIAFSHGIALAPRDGATGEEVLQRADARLYDEKRLRRETATAQRTFHWSRLVLPAVLLVLLGGLLWRSVRRTPIPSSPAPAAAAGEPPASDSEVDGLLRQIAELQAEVGTLRGALKEERSQGDRVRYEQQLRELDQTIAGLQARLVTPDRPAETPPAAAIEPPAANAPSTPQPASREPLLASPPAAPRPSPVEPSPAVLVRSPVLLAPVQPAYPRAARQLRRQATVELVLTVEADGRVSAAVPEGPRVGLGFEEAAQQAALRARFTPGTIDGVARTMQTRLTVRFEIGGS